VSVLSYKLNLYVDFASMEHWGVRIPRLEWSLLHLR